ncbi:MAG: FAD synthetase family protein, partial [Alphaproteobacteria bacterium]|nr:FAD synthetase family protein [Alphaproteobacteria bacterium]
MSKKIFCTQSSTPPVIIHFFPFHHGDKADQRGASVDNQTRHHRPQQSTTPTSASSAIVATIGNFDGFHRGHQFVIDRLETTARARGLPAWLITFDPHPRLLFDNNLNNFVITDRNEKITAARQYGLDGVAVIDFDHALASLSAETFVRDILKTQLQVDTLLLGEDFRFGRDRGGNIETLRQHGIDHVIPLPLQ